MIKHHNQDSLWRKRFISLRLPNHSLSLKKVIAGTQKRAGTWRQKLIKKWWRNATYWLALHGFFSQLSSSTQDHQPRVGSTHSKLGHPISIIGQENAPRIAYQLRSPLLGQYIFRKIMVLLTLHKVEKKSNAQVMNEGLTPKPHSLPLASHDPSLSSPRRFCCCITWAWFWGLYALNCAM